MRDSRNGTFGVLALVLSVLIKVACLAQFASATGLVVLIAGARVVARRDRLSAAGLMRRCMATGWARRRASRPTTMSGSRSPSARARLPAAAGQGLLRGDPGAGRGHRRGMVRPRWIAQRLGGYTGDTLGAVQQKAEIAFLVVAALCCCHARRYRTWRRRQDHGSRDALVVGAACRGAQSRRPLLRPVRHGLRRQQRGAVPAPGEAPAQGRGLVRVEPAARAQDRRHLGKAGAELGEVLIDPDLAEQHFG